MSDNGKPHQATPPQPKPVCSVASHQPAAIENLQFGVLFQASEKGLRSAQHLQKDPRLATEGTSVNMIEEYNLLQSQLSLSLCLRRTSRACYWSLFLTMIFYYVSSYNFYPFSIINLTK